MIKRVFILERGMLDMHNDRVIIEGIKFPKEKMTITQEFRANLPPIGIGTVFIEDGVLKCDAEIAPEFTVCFPSIGFRKIRWAKNQFGGVDMQECELVALGVSRHPNHDIGIKKICDQGQYMKCTKLYDDCVANCPSKDDKTICPNVKLKTSG